MNDLHRTGCGCRECGPPRRDPYNFEWPDEVDEVLTEDGVRFGRGLAELLVPIQLDLKRQLYGCILLPVV